MVVNMDITLMYFCGCSGWQAAEANLFTALAALRMPDASFCRRLIATVEEAERCPVHRFTGSPTVPLDAGDPFTEPGRQPGPSCRLYITGHMEPRTPRREQPDRSSGLSRALRAGLDHRTWFNRPSPPGNVANVEASSRHIPRAFKRVVVSAVDPGLCRPDLPRASKYTRVGYDYDQERYPHWVQARE